jgi:ABC-2 type transport system permease protein
MRKYLHVINIGIQNTLVYRANFLFRSTFNLVPLFATISLWRAVYASNDGNVAGYRLAEMVSYYLIVTIVDALTAVFDDDWMIAADIREGKISQFILQPIDYLTYRFCLFSSTRLVFSVVAAIPVTLFIFFQRKYFVPPPDVQTMLWFLVSVTMTALLQFLISYTMALLAFWLLEISTFIFIVFAFEYIAGGHLVPLDIMPPFLMKLLYLTPFPYQMFFPVSIYVGKTTGAAMYQGLVTQFLWVVAFYVIARVVWHRGIRKYSAVGG